MTSPVISTSELRDRLGEVTVLDVRYRLVSHSTHLGGFFADIEAELHRGVAFRFRGAAGRALRDSLASGAAAPRP